MSILDDLFGSGMDQYNQYANQAKGDINQYTNRAIGYLDPYRQAGQNALTGYQNMLGKYQDPTGYEDEIEKHYMMSPGAQFRMKYGMNALKGRLAAQGLSGSGAEDTALTNYTQGVISGDMGDYLNRVLGIGRTGLQGYGDLARMGEQGAITSGNYAQQAGEDIGGIDTAQANAAAKAHQNLQNNLWGGISWLGGNALEKYGPEWAKGIALGV